MNLVVALSADVLEYSVDCVECHLVGVWSMPDTVLGMPFRRLRGCNLCRVCGLHGHRAGVACCSRLRMTLQEKQCTIEQCRLMAEFNYLRLQLCINITYIHILFRQTCLCSAFGLSLLSYLTVWFSLYLSNRLLSVFIDGAVTMMSGS